MATLKVTTIDNQTAVIIPPEVAKELGIKPGDEVQLANGGNGSTDSPVERQVELMVEVMERRQAVLKRLSE